MNLKNFEKEGIMKKSRRVIKGTTRMFLILTIFIFLFTSIASGEWDINYGTSDFNNYIYQTTQGNYVVPDYSSLSDKRFILSSVGTNAIDLPAGASAEWWTTVQQNISSSEYYITLQENKGLANIKATYQAPNRAHNMRTHFTQEGIRIIPRTSTKSNWTWGLSLKGFGYEEEVQPVESSKLSVSGNRIKYRRGNITEWYVNDERGIEQGFTIQAPSESEKQHGSKIVLKLDIYGDLNGTLNSLVNSIKFTTAGGVGVVRYSELHAFDAGGRKLPAKFALADKTIDILVDASGALYPITIDPIASSPNWTAESNQADAGFGWSVGTAGDVNGDGYSDVIVGAPGYDNGESNEGRAYVYYGSASGLSTTPNWTAEANLAGASFGYSVGTAGDVNGDGYSDVIVGARYFGSLGEGRAFVYHGSASGLSTMANWSTDVGPYAWFGWSVGTAGDVNGDGYSDVIVGAINYDIPSGSGDFQGGAFVYHGSASGLSTTANWTVHSDVAYAYFGYSVGTAGDVNGDGYDDVIVGAKNYSNGEDYEGTAFVYYGSASGLSTTADWTAESNQASAYFGCSVGTAGDVNGDGYDDVIVGAEFYNIKGRAFVYYGSASGLSTTADWIAETDRNGNFGHSVSTAGDVNGDGYSDVIIGAFKYANGQSQEGAAFIYYGSASGLSTTADWIGEVNQAGAEFGCSVGTAGDVNGDGASDIIIGAHKYHNGEDFEGGAFLFAGVSSAEQWAFKYEWGSIGEGPSIQQTTDGGYIVGGSTEYFGSGYDDFWVLKLNSNGTIAWQKTYGGSSADRVTSVQQTVDGGYIVAGYTNSFGMGSGDFWILKLNSDGTIAWQKTYGRSSSDLAFSIQQTIDGGYIVAGGSGNFWVLKLNADGTISWQKTYGGRTSASAYSVQQSADGGYIVAGTICETDAFGNCTGIFDMWLLKLNSDGTIAWQKRYGGSSSDHASSVQQTVDGGYIVAGATASFGAGNYDFWVLKLNVDGTISWQKTYGGSGEDKAHSIQQTVDGGYILAGTTYSSSVGSQDMVILKLTTDGTVAWQKTYNGSSSVNWLSSIQETTDGNYVLAGLSEVCPYGYSDLIVMKLDANGEIPGCNIMGSFDANVTNTSAIITDTSVVPQDSAVAPSDTNVIPQDTAAGMDNICVSPPTIGYSPTSFSFSATQGGSNPPNQTLNISNTGAGTLNWTVSDDANWLTLNPTSGTDSGTVTVSVNIAGLTAGTYNATITITATGATNSPVDIPVTLIINEVAQNPVIDKILGVKEPGGIIRIIGQNFGNSQGNSIVHIGSKTFNSSSPRIKLWSDSKIKIKLPNYQCRWFKGQNYRYLKVWVTVDSVDSNKKRIKVLKPDTCP
jgi:uncharacterized delta-60 repeat protein